MLYFKERHTYTFTYLVIIFNVFLLKENTYLVNQTLGIISCVSFPVFIFELFIINRELKQMQDQLFVCPLILSFENFLLQVKPGYIQLYA